MKAPARHACAGKPKCLVARMVWAAGCVTHLLYVCRLRFNVCHKTQRHALRFMDYE